MKVKAYILFFLGILCFMFIGVGYIVSYTNQASMEIFNLESRILIIGLLLVLPVVGFLMIIKGLKLLNS